MLTWIGLYILVCAKKQIFLLVKYLEVELLSRHNYLKFFNCTDTVKLLWKDITNLFSPRPCIRIFIYSHLHQQTFKWWQAVLGESAPPGEPSLHSSGPQPEAKGRGNPRAFWIYSYHIISCFQSTILCCLFSFLTLTDLLFLLAVSFF